MSNTYTMISQIDIWGRLLTARHEPGSMAEAILKIGREHHLSMHSSGRRFSGQADNSKCVAHNIPVKTEKDSSQCIELTAFIAIAYTGGVLLVKSTEEKAKGCYFWGQPEDVEFVARLQRALAETVNDHVTEEYPRSVGQSEEYLKRGILKGLLGNWIMTLTSESLGMGVVEAVVEEKEALALWQLTKSGFSPLKSNMTRYVSETLNEVASALGNEVGSKL